MRTKRLKKRVISILLTFSMVLSLFAGQVLTQTESKAAPGENKITLGESQLTGSTSKSYVYPGVKIDLEDPNQKLYHLNVSVYSADASKSEDGGYMRVMNTAIAGTTGKGILKDGEKVEVVDLTNTGNFESISFDIEEGATAEQIEEFISKIQFVPGETEQMVSVSATGVKDATIQIGWKQYELKYFNGHFYGYIDGWWNGWKDSYQMARDLEFAGATGYLLTITSAAEDRFVWAAFGDNGVAKRGWMGCTRVESESGTYGGQEKWKALPDFNTEDVTQNKWRWVCGPEAGQVFGYQKDALGWISGDTPEGDFETADGFFTNWNVNRKWDGTTSPKEPNGGKLPASEGQNSNADEGYGYYGEDSLGNWNDHPEGWGKGSYVEFGSPEETFKEEDGKPIVIVTEVKGSEGTGTEDKPIVTPTPGPQTSQTPKPSTNPTAKPTPTIQPTAKPTADPGKTPITGKPVIEWDGEDRLTANIDDMGPTSDARNCLTYQWYYEDVDGTIVPIEGETKRRLEVPEELYGRTFIVEAIATGDTYTGIAESDPLIGIYGKVTIRSNERDDKLGTDIVREGTILSAVIGKEDDPNLSDGDGVLPEGSHDTLTYQWYVMNESGSLTMLSGEKYQKKNIEVTADVLGKQLVVEVTGNGKYYGSIDSVPYDATQTSANIHVTPPGEDPNTPEGWRVITVNPTAENTMYELWDETKTPMAPDDEDIKEIKVIDPDGNETIITDPAQTRYDVPAGSTIKFVVKPEGTYIVHEIKKKTEENIYVGPEVPKDDIKTDYDTEKKTATIIVDPANEDAVYSVLELQEDGITYKEIPVTKDKDGNYVSDPDSTEPWSDGGEKRVVFTGLDPDKTYKVVAKTNTDEIKDVKPSEMQTGTEVKTPPATEDPSPSPTPGGDTPGGSTPGASPTPGANTPGTSPAPGTNQGTTPGAGTNPDGTPATVYTQQEQDNAAKFVKEHLTDPKGKIVTGVTDLTRDLIVSGEADWKKLTDREKQAVNEKLKAAGCPYTYEELLKMAKSYKIPGFKVIKFMKKKSKAKLKLIKCKGATIACTSTNSKVATINKKGVISAKKVGRATLTFTAIKGKSTNRLVIDVRVKKKFKNAKELTKFNSKAIKTPTALIAKKRLLKKSSRIVVYDLEKSSKVKFEPLNKKVLTINKKGKYTGKRKGNSLVRIRVEQNKKIYWLYVYVTIY